jgi:uncharacterized protein YodC (DUF2158 family)
MVEISLIVIAVATVAKLFIDPAKVNDLRATLFETNGNLTYLQDQIAKLHGVVSEVAGCAQVIAKSTEPKYLQVAPWCSSENTISVTANDAKANIQDFTATWPSYTPQRMSFSSTAPPEIKAGSVVQLNGGGPLMTVEAVTDKFVKVMWIDSEGVQRAAFGPSVLTVK